MIRPQIDDFLSKLELICQTIDRAKIERVTNELFGAWEKERQVFVFGNGGSASTASHFACDLNKCTALPGKRRMRVLSLVDNLPWVSALTNDEGWDSVYVEQLRNFFRPGDLLLALSVHGGAGRASAGQWSQNCVKALLYGKENGGTVIGFSGYDGGVFNQICDISLIVPANSTPHVEAFHVVVHHLITTCLVERIRGSSL